MRSQNKGLLVVLRGQKGWLAEILKLMIICVPFYMFSYKVSPFHSSHCSKTASRQLRQLF